MNSALIVVEELLEISGLHAIAGRIDEPYTPNQKFAERRNRVIHQGEILNKTDATSFCSQAYDEIVKLTDPCRIPRPTEGPSANAQYCYRLQSRNY